MGSTEVSVEANTNSGEVMYHPREILVSNIVETYIVSEF